MEKVCLKVLIVGAGSIGSFFDTPKSNDVLTHAHAVTQSETFELIGFYDANIEKAKKAAELWNTSWYYSIDEALALQHPEVVVVSVSDSFHFEVMKSLNNKDIQLIVLEKPIGLTMEEAKNIVSIYNDSKIKVLVNYSRRFVPGFQKISNEIRDLKWGMCLNGAVYYGKGLLHNGSHAIDLIRMLLGEFYESFSYDAIADYSDEDKSVYALLRKTDHCIINLCPIDHKKYDIFEFDLFFEKGRIRIINSGAEIEIYTLQKHNDYEDYTSLKLEEIRKIELTKALHYMYKNIYDNLINGNELIGDLQEAYKTFQYCIRIKES